MKCVSRCVMWTMPAAALLLLTALWLARDGQPEGSAGQPAVKGSTPENPPAPTPPLAAQEYFSKVHCVCGPPGVKGGEHGCVPVVENALVTVDPRKTVTFTVFLGAPASAAAASETPPATTQASLETAFATCRARSYFPTADTKFVFASPPSASAKYQDACAAARAPIFPEVLFLIVRWGGWTPFHNLWDHGLFQVWLGFLTVQDYWAKLHHATAVPLAAVPALQLVHCLMGHRSWAPFPPIHDLWLEMLQPRRFYWMEQQTHCSRLAVVGDLPISTSGNHRHMHHMFVSSRLQAYVRNFSALTVERLVAQFGDVETSDTPVMFDARPPTDTFDHDQRTRGLQPALKNEFLAVLTPLVGKSVTRQMGDQVPLKTQFHWIRSARVIVAGEGALFAFMHLSRPGTTWICVYNHTRPAISFKFTNFHAPMGHALRTIQLVFYMIDHGQRVPVDMAIPKFFEEGRAFEPGVTYVGSDEFGHRMHLPA